jgi:hypothetical protein
MSTEMLGNSAWLHFTGGRMNDQMKSGKNDSSMGLRTA